MQTLPDKPTPLAEMLSISVPYASALLKGDRPWTRRHAIAAYRKTGVKVGPIADATDDEIDVLERFEVQPGSLSEQSAAA
jgi:hypothetical protein